MKKIKKKYTAALQRQQYYVYIIILTGTCKAYEINYLKSFGSNTDV